MSNYTKKYTEKLFSNPLARSIAVTGAVAPLIFLSHADKAHAEERFSGILNPGRPTQEQFEKSHMPWKRELAKIERGAEEFARLSTEAGMADSRTRAEFLIENGYTEEQCKKCKWLESPKTKDLYEKAKKYGVEGVAYGLPSRESDFMHFDKHGKPVESHKGAVGKLQVRKKEGKKNDDPGGFDEVYEIFNNPKSRHRDFIEKYKDSINKDAIFLRGEKKEVWKRVKYDPDANEIVGYVYLGYLKEKSGGDINIALERYNAGWNGRKKYPNNARKYRKGVLSRQKKWHNLKETVCPEIESRYKAFQERRYRWRKSNDFAAGYYQRH